MTKQEIIKALYDTIDQIEAMPKDEFAEKCQEVNALYDEMGLHEEILLGTEQIVFTIDMSVTPSTYKTPDNNNANGSDTCCSAEEIDTLNIGIAA